MFSKLYTTLVTAGSMLHEHWNRSPTAMFKKDGSPVTPADIEVNEFLTKRLQDDFSIPVVSEECVTAWETRKEYNEFWLLDPLDGTKEFIGRYGDFSICLALIRNKRPILGIVYAPALSLLYYGGANLGVFCYRQNKKEPIGHITPKISTAMISRFHNDSKVEEFCKINTIERTYMLGGALKYCYIAEGKGSVYIRYNKMKEWDVAAGDIILQEAGGSLISLDSKQKPLYNNEDMTLAPFIATAHGVDANGFGV